ncbi:MAG: aminotransferase [Deltaproteobacteria bacterium]|nr:aminotransferase [Deltaproteobacteria bacterium]
MDIPLQRVSNSRLPGIDLDNLGFGEIFSDHMFLLDYKEGQWQSPRIVPFGNIEVSPSMCTLHYGQAVFEGLKAFRNPGDGVTVFRPEKYHARLNRSCQRLCIPALDKETFFEGLRQLITVDRNWVPRKRGYSLYIRPFVFATDNFLGVHVSKTYLFLIITSPVGAYYKEGMNPVSLITSGEYVRAVKGGIGAAKTPGNYAASLLPAQEAQKKGFTQVLWLDGVENRYIEEVGTMNIFFVIDGGLVTPPLEGSILGGITRETVLELGRHWGMPVTERRITIDEVLAGAKNGSLTEIFGTGTAAVISPVGLVQHKEERVTVNNGKIGPVSQRLYDEITGVQYGEKPDTFGWCFKI